MDRKFLSRFDGVPSLLSVHAAPILAATAEFMASFSEDSEDDDLWGTWLKPYTVQEGVLRVPVTGILVHGTDLAIDGWFTGYDYLVEAVQRGMDDPQVNAIAMIVDSPGGMVSGAFDAGDQLWEMRKAGGKPVKAFVNESAYSAAYLIASTADEIIVPRTGGVGSVGVVLMHVDYSKAMEKAGITITPIFAGAHKVDGNPYQPLSDSVHAQLQQKVDDSYAIFVDSVARNRGIDPAAVRATEAATYIGQRAVEAGLADSVLPFDTAFSSLIAACKPKGSLLMTDKKGGAASTAAEVDVDAVRTEARAEGVAQGALAERSRIKAITGSEHAAGRLDLATHLAFETDMAADAAVALLSKAPKATEEKAATAGATHFEQAMAKGNPGIKPEASNDSAQAGSAAELLGALKMAGGRVSK